MKMRIDRNGMEACVRHCCLLLAAWAAVQGAGPRQGRAEELADWDRPVVAQRDWNAAPPRIELLDYEEPAFAPLPPPTMASPPAAGPAAGPVAAAGPAEQQKLGTPPPDNHLQFLRDEAVLLAPGQGQFDFGIEYQWQQADLPVLLSGGTVAQQQFRERRLLEPFALRYGLTPRMQAYLSAPVGWDGLSQQNGFTETETSAWGIGDVSAGVNYLLRKAECGCPDVIGTLGFTAATGQNPFGSGVRVAALGTGFWALSADLLAIKTYDPVVLFYGAGYKHYFQHEYQGSEVTPGEEVNYRFGAGLAVNDRITVSTMLLGTYDTEVYVDHVRQPGTAFEPISLRLAVTIVASECYIIEPFARFGITADAPNADIGITVTRNF
ncbi:MAG: transporter [Thermoguttaceae bacterium]